MPTPILMPALSPTMEKGKLAKWLKKEGDEVRSGDVIAEIETDKATMEVEAVDEGRLGKIVVPEGTDDVAVNSPIAMLLAEGEDESALESAGPPSSQPSPPGGEGAEKAPPKALSPPARGQGEEAPPPTRHKAEGRQPSVAPPTPSPAMGRGIEEGPQTAAKADGQRIFASPLARRIAKEKGIELAAIKGSGPHGRIVLRDVEAATAAPEVRPSPARVEGAPPLAAAMPDEAVRKLFEEGTYEIVPHDGMRKIIAARLVQAKQTIPHFYLTVDCKLDNLLTVRQRVNDSAPKDKDGKPAWKLSVNDFVTKALALALKRVPEANATWTEGGMLRHKRIDVGVAVAVEGGLFTPVVRSADQKTLSQISNEMKDLASRARKRRLAPHEYQGGSTAVSNLGMYGIRDFAAVINPPHATILAVGAGEERPIVVGGKVEIRTIMTVTLSCDHRVVDGALGAELLAAFRSFVEEPALMLA